nr:nicotinate-nucleotide--dimethylbenzimidazole phosphoribosyltransferase [uncultured Agathobaculum sp.]
MDLRQTITAVRPVCEDSRAAVRRRFSDIAIPLGSLGLLQEAVAQLGAIQRTVRPLIERRVVVIFCADNGVVAQGVTQCGQEITATVAENMDRGQSTVCLMARHIGMDSLPVDIGIVRDVQGARIIRRKIRYGTADMTKEPAMTREEAVRALETGIALAGHCAAQGYQLVCGGEMGIGNTTSSAAVAAALTGAAAVDVTGRGAGLSSAGLMRKVRAVEAALSLHRPDPGDPIDVLHKVGGLDIAGLAGLYLGAAACGLPVVLDGVISCAAALIAVRLCPAVHGYLIAAHQSAEPAGRLLLETLGCTPFISAGMRLGEGTGAVAAVALLDLVLAAYNGMPRFDEVGIEPYRPLS